VLVTAAGLVRAALVRGVHGLEVGAFHAPELGHQHVVVPAGIGAPEMNQELPLSASSIPYFLSARRITWTCGENVLMSEARLQAQACPHRRVLLARQAGGVMLRRPDVGAARLLRGEAQRMRDLAGGDFIVAREPGKDGKAGRVGGGPALGPQRVGAQVPFRARAGAPRAVTIRKRGVKLVEDAVVAIDREDVTVAVRIRTAFDRGIGRDGVGARIALVAKSNDTATAFVNLGTVATASN
jgi:hypothetical protein